MDEKLRRPMCERLGNLVLYSLLLTMRDDLPADVRAWLDEIARNADDLAGLLARLDESRPGRSMYKRETSALGPTRTFRKTPLSAIRQGALAGMGEIS